MFWNIVFDIICFLQNMRYFAFLWMIVILVEFAESSYASQINMSSKCPIISTSSDISHILTISPNQIKHWYFAQPIRSKYNTKAVEWWIKIATSFLSPNWTSLSAAAQYRQTCSKLPRYSAWKFCWKGVQTGTVQFSCI